MKKIVLLLAGILFLAGAATSFADLQQSEKDFIDGLSKVIPKEKIVSVDALYQKWLEVEAGKSKALILDIRTESEFDCGHILNSSNIDSGHAYALPKKFADPEAEIWVFCRTENRATYFVSMLYSYGYKNVYLVKGGIKDWAEKGYPLVNKYLGEITVAKYHKKMDEKYDYRENR